MTTNANAPREIWVGYKSIFFGINCWSKEWYIENQLSDLNNGWEEKYKYILATEHEALQTELNEQARLNGIGAERELKLQQRADKAIKTLELSGYTDCGGELWKPPIGNLKDLQQQVEALKDALKDMIWAATVDPSCQDGVVDRCQCRPCSLMRARTLIQQSNG